MLQYVCAYMSHVPYSEDYFDKLVLFLHDLSPWDQFWAIRFASSPFTLNHLASTKTSLAFVLFFEVVVLFVLISILSYPFYQCREALVVKLVCWTWFWEMRVSLYSQARLELSEILQPVLPECWD